MGKRRKAQSEFEEIESLKKELQRARSKGLMKEVADLLNRLGTSYRELKLFDHALEQHEEEAQVTKKYFPTDVIGLAIALRAKAEVYLEMKEEEAALPLVREYLKISRNAADLVEEQRAHITMGRVFLGLAFKYAESDEPTGPDSKAKALAKAEDEFQKARELANRPAMEDKRLGPVLMDMRCGVLLNIAIVHDMKGNIEGSKQFLLKGIEIAKEHKFYENMYRGYVNLCEIYCKLDNFKEAHAAAAEAAKAGKALENFALEGDAKVLEAKMYFMLDEITSGVRILKKLRKQIRCKQQQHLGESAQELLEGIEPLLEAGVRITRNEDALHVADKTAYEVRKKLFERLGDAYVELGNYAEAVRQYSSAIENAEKANLGPKELAKLYYSVAETYKDKGDNLSALQYFQKEIQLHGDNPSEAFKTQTNITATLEKLHDDSQVTQEEILAAHEKALDLALLCRDSPRKEMAALTNFASYLKAINRNVQASEMRNRAEALKKLHKLADEEPDSQDLLDGGDGDDADSDAVDLDRLTTDDDSSDEDDGDGKAKSGASAVKKRKFRVNEKGETPLHKASIKGDIKLVRRLLRQGHEVNVKDMGGWVPLHEACNFGYLEIVEELLKNGAHVNVKCGHVCGELTPLHDAANNGHTAVMLLLLNHKANVLARDTKGNYAIDLLIAWRERAKADGTVFAPEDLAAYREMRSVLKDLMEKGGKSYQRTDEVRARKLGKTDTEASDTSPKFDLIQVRGARGGPVPVKLTVENYDPDDANAVVDLYSTTISGLRRKPPRNRNGRDDAHSDDESVAGSSSIGGSAISSVRGGRLPPPPEATMDGLIPASQYVDDDWLVDGGDLQQPKPKHAAATRRKRERERDPMDEIRAMDSRSTRRRRKGQRNDLARLDIGQDDDDLDLENEEELLDLDLDTAEEEAHARVRPSNHTAAMVIDDIDGDNSECGSDSDDVDMTSGSGGQRLRRRNRTVGSGSGAMTFSQLMEEGESDQDEQQQPEEIIPAKKSVAPIILSSDEDEDDSEEAQGISLYHRLNNEEDAFAGPSTSTATATARPATSLSRNRSNNRIQHQHHQTRLPFKVVSNGAGTGSSSGIGTGSSGKISKSTSELNLNLNRYPESILRLRIHVNDKLFVVPVVESHLNDTIEWLCEECSRRYFDTYHVKPILTLSTSDGAILSPSDVIRVVLCGNETELIATVLSFDLERLPERFKTAALKTPGLKYDDEILPGLEVCQSSNVLHLPGCSLRNKIGQTLFQSVQYQSSLRELCLPDCALHDEGVQHLASIIPALQNLITLDLSCNGVTGTGINHLSEAFKKAQESAGAGQGQSVRQGGPALTLTTLNLSFNPLGNCAGPALSNFLTQLSQLKVLVLVSCDFNVRLLAESRLSNCLSKLRRLEELDVSYNEWGKTGLDLIFKSLPPGNVGSLKCTSGWGEEEEEEQQAEIS